MNLVWGSGCFISSMACDVLGIILASFKNLVSSFAWKKGGDILKVSKAFILKKLKLKKKTKNFLNELFQHFILKW